MAEDNERYNSPLTGAQVDVALQDMANHISERYAKGTANGVPVTSGQVGFEDNAKYYANLAQSAVPAGVDGAVLWSQSQLLTDEQKAVARANIGAVAEGEGGSVQDVQIGGVSVVTNKIANVPLSNPNLLDNGWLQIDQRQGYIQIGGTMMYSDTACTQEWGVSGSTTPVRVYGTYARPIDRGIELNLYIKASDVVRGYVGQGYTVDRWESFYIDNVVKVTDNGIVLNCTDLCQKIPLKDIPINTPLTASILYADGEIDYLTFTFDGTIGQNFHKVTQSKNVEFWVAYDVWSTTGNFQFFINTNGGEVGVLAVKLELGSVSTLANDIAPNKDFELIKCQGEYWSNLIATQPMIYAGELFPNGWCAVTLPIKFNRQPTLDRLDQCVVVRETGTPYACSSMNVDAWGDYGVRLAFSTGVTQSKSQSVVVELKLALKTALGG